MPLEEDQNDPASPYASSRRDRTPGYALEQGPRKKASSTNPLVHHGRHFGRTIHGFCQVYTLLNNAVARQVGASEEQEPPVPISTEDNNERRVFKQLLLLVPGLQERLFSGDDRNMMEMAELMQRGINGARSDDTKGLKGAILDMISSHDQYLHLKLARNMKIDRGFHHECTGALLCPTGLDWNNAEVKAKLKSGEMTVPGDQWPVFLYTGSKYNSEDAWSGLLRSAILLSAYRFIFTSPSSVDKEPRATRSGNARIHGMVKVTPASIAYVATQVRFALCSSTVFSRTDTTTDSERFYCSILQLLNDPEEREEVADLLLWWNKQVFPGNVSVHRPLSKNSALSRIKEQRAERILKALNAAHALAGLNAAPAAPSMPSGSVA